MAEDLRAHARVQGGCVGTGWQAGRQAAAARPLPSWPFLLSYCCRPPAAPTLQVQDVSHGGGRSTVACDAGVTVTGSLVVDATGHSRKLVEYDQPFDPGEGPGGGLVGLGLEGGRELQGLDSAVQCGAVRCGD